MVSILTLFRFKRLGLVALLLGVQCLIAHGLAAPKIVPVHLEPHLSSMNEDSEWSAPIKGINGRTLYVLSLHSDGFYAKGDFVEGLELALYRHHDRSESNNLLAPVKNWHGAQPFLFDSYDLKGGPGSSVYGAERTITVDSLGLVLKISIVRVDVIGTCGAQIDDCHLNALELQVDVDNAGGK